jgi:MtN3 and saliva related transmembrane protein
MPIETIIGSAAVFTTASYDPQVQKTLTTAQTGTLSLKMLQVWSTGRALWLAYGGLEPKVVMLAANGISLPLLARLRSFKVRAEAAPST